MTQAAPALRGPQQTGHAAVRLRGSWLHGDHDVAIGNRAALGPLHIAAATAEPERRRAAARARPVSPARRLRGWPALHAQHVLQAPQEFLTAPTTACRRPVEPAVGRS